MFEYRTALFGVRGAASDKSIPEVDQYINSQIVDGWEYESLCIGGNNIVIMVVVVMRRVKPPPVPHPQFFTGVEDSAK